jgi:hypothetical protein
MAELDRRLQANEQLPEQPGVRLPPTIALKGLNIHLQSAVKLAETLEEFATTGKVSPFEEVTPSYSLRAASSTEGLELRDSDTRIALTVREARKWTGIVSSELDRLNVRQVERGRIRTIFAVVEDGQWIMQWGDEIFAPDGIAPSLKLAQVQRSEAGGLLMKQDGGFRLLLNRDTGACVALEDAELGELSG